MLRWLDHLDDEDAAFLKRFILASGSLKELAEAYGVSYPTIRLRLDRLIAKIEVYDSAKPMSEFERTARALAADGKIEPATLKSLLKAHQSEMEKSDEDQRHIDLKGAAPDHNARAASRNASRR
jgi:hypothetical protein